MADPRAKPKGPLRTRATQLRVQDVKDAASLRDLIRSTASIAWSAITGKPTTLAGYGITDGVSTSRTISTTAPLAGGGDLSANRTLTVSTMTGDSGSGGAPGVVPAPAAGDAAAGKFLDAAGAWSVPAGSGAPTNADYLVKTANGSLSAERVVTDTASVTWDWATAGQAKASVPSGDASTPGLVKLGAAGGALAYTATPQTISGATGTVTDGTEIVRVTHAAVTALTLPALANTTRPVVILGPAAVAGVSPTCVLARAGSDVIDSGATGLKIEGSNYRITMVSDGAVWRVTDVRGVCQLPVGYVDLTGVSAGSPWTRTDGVNGETVTMTDTSTSGSCSAASGIQITTPAAGTAVYASSTGAGFYTDVLARAGLDVVRDEYAFLVKLTETSSPTASDADAVFLGTTIAAATKLGMGYGQTTGTVTVRYGTTSYTVATTATGHAAKGLWYDGRSRSWEALEGAWSGTAQTTLWPLSYASPGGVQKHAMDTAATSAPLDFALPTRLVIAASTGSGGARNWLCEYLYVVRILRG